MDTKSLHGRPYQALTQWLKNERESQGLSVRELADKADVFPSLIGKVEQQERNLSIVEYVEYCNALGIDPSEGIQIVQKSLKASQRKK